MWIGQKMLNALSHNFEKLKTYPGFGIRILDPLSGYSQNVVMFLVPGSAPPKNFMNNYPQHVE